MKLPVVQTNSIPVDRPSATAGNRDNPTARASVASLNVELRDRIAEHLPLQALAALRQSGRLFRSTKNYALREHILTCRRQLPLLLKTSPRLQRLTLVDPDLTDDDLQRISEWQLELCLGLHAGWPHTDFSLKELTIEGVARISDVGLLALGTLDGLTSIHLDLSGCTGITGVGLGHLSGLTGLHELQLPGQQFRGNDLCHLQKMSTLRKLSVGKLQANDLTLFPHLQLLTSLRSLEIDIDQNSGNLAPTDTDRFAHLNPLIELQKLRYLSNNCPQDGDQVTDEDVMQIGTMHRLIKLEITASGVSRAALSHLGQLTALQELALYELDLPVTESAPWNWLKNLTALESLRLVRCYLSCEVLAPLATLTTLKELYIDDQMFFDEALFENLPLSLESLDVTDSQLTNDSLGFLQRLPALATLILNGCYADYETREACDDEILAPLHAMPGLKTIDVSNCGFSEEATALLRATPGRTVITDSPQVGF